MEHMMLRGFCNVTEFSRMFEVDITSIFIDVKEIRQRWLKETPGDIAEKLAYRLKQIEAIYSMSIIAYEISRKQEEEYAIKDVPCDAHCTAGIVKTDKGNKECERCGGRGTVTIEVRTVKGNPGDPAFLNVAKSCVTEMAKLEGLYPMSGVHSLKRTTEREVVLDSEDGAAIREKIEELYIIEDEDVIVNCMSVLDKLRHKTDQKVRLLEVDAETTDVKDESAV